MEKIINEKDLKMKLVYIGDNTCNAEIYKYEVCINTKKSKLNEDVQANNNLIKEDLEYYSNILNNENINKMKEKFEKMDIDE